VLLVSAKDTDESVGRRRILDVVSSGVSIGAARVKFEASTGVGRRGSGCAIIAGAGAGGTYMRSSGVNLSSSSSSSPSLSPASPSSGLIPPSSSNSGLVWCERRVCVLSIPSTASEKYPT
jgi:hypothetical protein